MKAPSVIIGVGGIGSQICSRVEKELYRVRSEENKGSLEHENTRFVVMDTDINSLRELHRNGFRGKRILLTDNMTVAKCRDIINDSLIDEWYPKNTIFSKKSMTEGAGQQRSISRLAFEYCIRDGRLKQLDDVVRELNELSVEDSSQQTRFYIISSLAGGTGSGLILPLAMYINRFIQEEQGDDLAICKGFFILSNAFYSGCESELERKSLDANAYAAIKELSAFMRSADDAAASHPNYFLPGYGKYDGSTYEYCYLFGMTNANSKNIRSFETLKNMVADAVYMQACSPIHDRNSSREDNSVRHTTMLGQENQENWRRRFGGIGCGRLIYPYKELVRYFGLQWAKDTMEKEWRNYDIEYRNDRRKIVRIGRRKNKSSELNRGNYYMKAVDEGDISDWLAEHIREECRVQDQKALWACYLEAIEKEAEKQIDILTKSRDMSTQWEQFKENMDGLRNRGNSRIQRKERGDRKKFLDKRWKSLSEDLDAKTEELSINNRLFQIHSWELFGDTDEIPECYLEHWLITKDGNFFHPNSIRYFLYQTEKMLASRKSGEIRLENLNPKVMEKEKHHLRYGEGSKYYEEFKQLTDELYKRVKNKLRERFFAECEKYIKKLIRCYEEFYDSYDMVLDEFVSDMKMIEKKLDQVSGVAYAYVCADKTCREKMHKELCERRGYDEDACSGVSGALYRLMHELELDHTKMGTRECADKMKEYWYREIGKEKVGKEILDMNILKALNKEAEYHSGKNLTEDQFGEKMERIQQVLVAPFLQYFQRIDMVPGIVLYCYHSKLKQEVGTYRNMVDWLDNHSAVDDDTYCSEREILFYRSFVGLEANEVLDYLHGLSVRTSVTGRAFRSYQSMLWNMGKNSGEGSKVITPHADINWHNLHYMSDPSKIYQEEQERLIAVALLYAWASGKIKKEADPKAYIFTFENENREFGSLYLCHLEFYGNYYWYMSLYEDMQKLIKETRAQREDCYQKIAGGKNAFEFFASYLKELSFEERGDKKKWELADAVKAFIYECTEGNQENTREEVCKETVCCEIDKIISSLEEEKESNSINASLADEMICFLHIYQNNM